MAETVLDLANAYSTMSDAELEAALRSAQATRLASIEIENDAKAETIFMQQDRIVQAIRIEQSRRSGRRAKLKGKG